MTFPAGFDPRGKEGPPRQSGGAAPGPALAVAVALALAVGAGPARAAPVAPEPRAELDAGLGDAGSAGAALVPESADGALLLDGAGGADGLRAFLAAAGALAPSLAPDEVSAELVSRVAVDLLAPAAAARAGLAQEGVRALVFAGSAAGLSAPVADAGRAARRLADWVAEAAPPQRRPAPRPRGKRAREALEAGRGAQARAGSISAGAGGPRLLVASGKGAAALVRALSEAAARRTNAPSLSRDRAVREALAATPGKAVLWLRGAGPALGAVIALRGSAQGLDGAGVLLAAGQGALFAGPAPAQECDRAIVCARANLSPATQPLLARAARELAAGALPAARREPLGSLLQRAALAARGPAALRVDGVDAAALGSLQDIPRALSFLARAAVGPLSLGPPGSAPGPAAAAPDGGVSSLREGALCLQTGAGLAWLGSPCPRAPPPQLAPATGAAAALEVRLDTRSLATALSRLGPLDALRGDAAAGAYALHLLFGRLLGRSGPATLTLGPGAARPRDQRLELHWPLHGRALPQ